MKPEYIGKGDCQNCDEEVDVYLVDNGIGPYEYWGVKGNDVQKEPCCCQCGSYMEDFQETGNIWMDY